MDYGLGKRGQSLAELAVFGSFVLLALGTMLNYGLNYDAQQRSMMTGFRSALSTAAEPGPDGKPMGTGNTSHLDLRHLPSPGSPFGIGTVSPVPRSSSVTRTVLGSETAEVEEELPRTRILLQGKEFDCPSEGRGCTTAGFRIERGVVGFTLNKEGGLVDDPKSVDMSDRYVQVYGLPNMEFLEEGECAEPQEVIDPSTGETTIVCLKKSFDIRIIDTCEGEIVNLGGCHDQARLIVDNAHCARRCERGKRPGDDKTDCQAVCRQHVNRPNDVDARAPDPQRGGAAYAADYTDGDGAQPLDGKTLIFPRLLDLFCGPGDLARCAGQSLGLLTERTFQNSRLGVGSQGRPLVTGIARTENATHLTTTTTLNWTDHAGRLLAYRGTPNATWEGTDEAFGGTMVCEPGDPVFCTLVIPGKDEHSSTTWTTPW